MTTHVTSPYKAVTTTRAVVATYDVRATAVVAVGSVGVMAVLVLVAHALGDGFSVMTRDPLAIARAGDDATAVHTGWLSNGGVLVWAAAAGAALMAGRTGLPSRPARMLLCAGVISGGLVADDLFELHEQVVPRLTRFTEEHIMLGWALLVALFVVVFRRELVRSPVLPVLVLAVGYLGISMVADVADDIRPVNVLSRAMGGHAVLEEGAKLVGILCWSSFLWLQGRALHAPRRPE